MNNFFQSINHVQHCITRDIGHLMTCSKWSPYFREKKYIAVLGRAKNRTIVYNIAGYLVIFVYKKMLPVRKPIIS